jgi:ribosome-associated protein
MTGYEKSIIIENLLNEKKAIDVKIVDLEGISIIADCFVVATGMNKKHIETLADYCEEALEEKGEKKLRREKSNEWVLIDFGDLIIHIFDQEARAKYSLEDLWSGKLK